MDREKTHGPYALQAFTSQKIKDCVTQTSGWSRLDPIHRDALEMISVKISRILTGDHRYMDHWEDIAGYAKLVVKYHKGDG